MTPAERVAIREAIAKLEQALAEDDAKPAISAPRCTAVLCADGQHRRCTLDWPHEGPCKR